MKKRIYKTKKIFVTLEISYNLVGTRISCKIFFSCDTDVMWRVWVFFYYLLFSFFILLLWIFCSFVYYCYVSVSFLLNCLFYSSWFLISYCFFSSRIYFFQGRFCIIFLLARSVLLSDDKLNDLQRKFFLHFSTDIACFFSNKHDQKKVKEKNCNLLFCCIGSVFQVSHLGLVDFLIVF